MAGKAASQSENNLRRSVMMLTRRKLIQGTAAAAVSAAPMKLVFGQAAEFTYKFADGVPATHPVNVRAQAAADAIRSETGGRLDIQVFPSGQLGSDTDTISQVRSGGVEFLSMSGLVLSTLVPAASLNGVAFAFPDYAAVWRAMDGEVGAYVRSQMAKVNLVAMDKIWDNGYRQTTTSNKPINGPDDLMSLKIRVPVAPMWTSMFKALGAAPTSINASEMYTALQTKVVDAQENPLSNISAFKLYEVQKYCSMTNHMWDGYWCLANRRAWERLPEKIREIAARHLNAAAVAERADIATLNSSLQKELAAKGMLFNNPDAEPFRQKLRSAGYYSEWKSKFGQEAWAVLERSTGKLA
jgi:TRAP-type transport system periplasmic protein